MTLEEELKEMRAHIDRLDERLRLRRVAETFPETPILAGNYFTSMGEVGYLHEIKSDGKWDFTLGRHTQEGRRPTDPERLFTLDEVKQIIAETIAAWPWEPPKK